jgi:hypothetical protein
VWHIPDAVCTVLDSWWWTERPSETCRVLLQNEINLIYCALCWFYYRNILRCCTVRQTSKIFNIELLLTAFPLSLYIRMKSVGASLVYECMNCISTSLYMFIMPCSRTDITIDWRYNRPEHEDDFSPLVLILRIHGTSLSRGHIILTSRELTWCYECSWDV